MEAERASHGGGGAHRGGTRAHTDGAGEALRSRRCAWEDRQRSDAVTEVLVAVPPLNLQSTLMGMDVSNNLKPERWPEHETKPTPERPKCEREGTEHKTEPTHEQLKRAQQWQRQRPPQQRPLLLQ
jgi:hypothetical protein